MDQLFIALPVNKILRSQLERLCFGLPNMEWTEHTNFYIILANLGQADGALQLDIQEALLKTPFPPFDLYLKGVNYLAKNKTSGIIWAAVNPTKELTLFYKLLHTQLAEIIPKSDLKTIPPYVILGRYEKIDERRLLDYLAANSDFISQPFKNNFILLLKKYHDVFHEVARITLN